MDELKLQALHETMVAVNHIVLNRLFVIRMIVDDLKNGNPTTVEHIEILDFAVSEIVDHLAGLSELTNYETHEIVEGLRAVKYPSVTT
jgi:hypothetical protein